jgi:DNA-directed RNA polymerase alpha subunit
MNFEDYIESELAHKEVLEESSYVENVQGVFKSLSTVFDKLSLSFQMMDRDSNVNGGGEVPRHLRNAEVALVSAKDKIKFGMKHKDAEDFTKEVKDAVRGIGDTLKTLKNKCEMIAKKIEPEFTEVPYEPEVEMEVEPQKQEAVIMDRRKRSKKIV